MINKINITIPEPCRENWNAMTLSEKGKFCASCQKNVTDFRGFSDREIIKYYNLNSRVCGRFASHQLNRNLILPKEKNSFWMLAAASILAFLGFGSQAAKAQALAKMEQTDNKAEDVKIEKTKKNKTEIITGLVTDGKVPIPGVSVGIKGSNRQTTTDLNGNFTIEVKKRDVLVFSFIGFNSVEKKISEKTKINIAMKEQEIMMGEVVIINNSN